MINSLFSCALLDVTVQLLIFHKTLENISSSDVFFLPKICQLLATPKRVNLVKLLTVLKRCNLVSTAMR
jgi:hypothetical protein